MKPQIHHNKNNKILTNLNYYLMNRGPNVSMGILDRTKYQGPFGMDQCLNGCFGHAQMSCKDVIKMLYQKE